MAQQISQEILQRIKSAVNILQVVGEHVVLRKSGANYTGLCPFHSERTPSFSVSESKQLYHCYGCKKGGDLVSFVMDIMGLSFIEAVQDLADRAGIPFKGGDSHAANDPAAEAGRAKKKKFELALKLNRFAAAYFHKQLSTDKNAQEYARKRGVSTELKQRFYVGAAPGIWDGLAKHLVASQAPLDLAVEVGLIRPSKQDRAQRPPGSADHFDLFRNRLIFPILNLRGKVAGFGGRALGDETPKYLNSPESLVFLKSRLAFGLYQSQKFIREQDEVILVEGYFDVLALHAAGFQNVVSPCGTALTPELLKILSRLASRIVVLFDGDEAGQSAMVRAMELGLESGYILYGAAIPDGLDPDQLVMSPEGEIYPDAADRVRKVLNRVRPLLDARIEEAIQMARKSPEDRVQALKKIGAWLKRLNDPVGRDVRIQLLNQELGVSNSWAQTVLVGEKPPVKPQEAQRIPRRAEMRVSVLSNLDKIALKGMLQGQEYLEYFLNLRDLLPTQLRLVDLLDSKALREFLASVLDSAEKVENFVQKPEALLDGELDPQIQAVISESLLNETRIEFEDFKGILMKRVSKCWARISQQIRTAISEAEAKKNAELQQELMKEYLDVQRKMKEFSSFYDQA